MIITVKEVAQAIRNNKPTNMDPDLYTAVKDIVGYTKESLIAGVSLISMNLPHWILWLMTYLGKYYANM
jgi:hypothetical protein